MVISHLYIFFVELSLRFKWVVFLLLSFKHSYVFLISHYQIGLLEIFSRSTLIVLLFSWHCLLQSDVYLILIKYSILIISFTNCAFDTLSIKLSPYLSSSRLFLLLFSKSLIVLCLYIDLCYTLIFCDSFKLGICLFFLACGCPVVPTAFVEWTVFLIVLPFLLYQKSGLYLCGSISGFSILFHWCICLFFHQNSAVLITVAL